MRVNRKDSSRVNIYYRGAARARQQWKCCSNHSLNASNDRTVCSRLRFVVVDLRTIVRLSVPLRLVTAVCHIVRAHAVQPINLCQPYARGLNYSDVVRRHIAGSVTLKGEYRCSIQNPVGFVSILVTWNHSYAGSVFLRHSIEHIILGFPG